MHQEWAVGVMYRRTVQTGGVPDTEEHPGICPCSLLWQCSSWVGPRLLCGSRTGSIMQRVPPLDSAEFTAEKCGTNV